MTLIKELNDWIDKEMKIQSYAISRETTLFEVQSKLKELAKKDRTFLEKSFTKNLNNFGYEDSVKFVIDYKKDLEEVIKDEQL